MDLIHTLRAAAEQRIRGEEPPHAALLREAADALERLAAAPTTTDTQWDVDGSPDASHTTPSAPEPEREAGASDRPPRPKTAKTQKTRKKTTTTRHTTGHA